MREPKDVIINGKTLAEIIENHKHWLRVDCEGCCDMRADLSGANLSDAYLRGANLRGAYLRGANLRGAYLSDANLSDADLSGANLRGAYLSGANLSGANLSDANLSGANLRGANLSDAYLRGANLRGAYLRGANLSGANLSDANLSGANLRGANLRGADLRGANLRGAYLSDANLSVKYNENTAFFALQCPEDGAYIGWKKASGYIIKLRITEDAKRSSATSRKCRASKAEVLEIQNIDGSKADVERVCSNKRKEFIYEVGKIVEVNDFDTDRWNECSTGIHHFITRQEAVNY